MLFSVTGLVILTAAAIAHPHTPQTGQSNEVMHVCLVVVVVVVVGDRVSISRYVSTTSRPN